MEPGHYRLSIRAGGYELDSPNTVDLSEAQPATAEIRLGATNNIASQLTDGEWLACRARTAQKKYCHTLQPIERSVQHAAEFLC